MSQTKVFLASKATTVRTKVSTGATSGSGQSKRLYVGRHGGYDYDSYVKFTLDWTNVGRIVSAVLSVYTDDGLGVMPSTTNESPKVKIKRLTAAFTEGNAPDGEWQANDWTSAAKTATGAKYPAVTRAELGLTSVDITDIVRAWADKTVAGGRRLDNHGIAILGYTDNEKNIALCSDKWTNSAYRPSITLTYEYGPTTPDAPSANMSPSGSVASFSDFQGDFDDLDTTDELAASQVQLFDPAHAFTVAATGNAFTDADHGLQDGDVIYLTTLTDGAGLSTFTKYYVVQRTNTTFKVSTTSGGSAVDVTSDGSGNWSRLLYGPGWKAASVAEKVAAHFTHVPDDLTLAPGTTYQWRARVKDFDGDISAWSSILSFSFTNTAPTAPTLSPADATSQATPDGLLFEGTFADADTGDYMLAYEVQMSAYPEGSANWNDASLILWNTGKRYVPGGDTSFSTPYGGASLAAGTYYWRARVYDSHHAVSNWTYSSLVFTGTFEQDPATVVTAVQLRPRAPWRVVIRDLGANRGPGDVVAVLEDAKNAGASELYNSPGEVHFTLPKGHPQISVIEPRKTHYAVEFRQGDGWHEVYAGLIMDFDATDTDVVFYGIDYLGLLDYIVDERYDPSNPDKAAEKGGSKYITTGKNSIGYIVRDQLARAVALPNSPVGFISLAQSSATLAAMMAETLVVYSTYSPVLQFVVGLIDSHRSGTGKRTRLRVRKTSAGGYEFLVQDDPGTTRDNLRLRYGELVQGYRVVAFGTDWASRIHGIGRLKDGVKVLYKKQVSTSIDESVWGRFTQVRLFDGVSDENDLNRRLKQAATSQSTLGKQIGLGIRSGILQPKDGYEVCDAFPIDIEDGSVSTSAFGSGYWTCVGVTWEASAQDGKQNTTLSFQTQEDSVAPDSDLLTLEPISPQAEWQIGWTDPNPLTASSKYWLDQSTGIAYVRTDGTLVAEGITGTA